MIINQVVSGGGTTPTGTKSITANGVYDVTNYASADVQVPTTAPVLYREFQLDANGKLTSNPTTPNIIDFTGMKNIGASLLYQAYYNNTIISGAVDLSSLTEITGGNSACYQMFYGCTGLTSVDLSSLTDINSSYACYQMFYGCTGLTSVDLSSFSSIQAQNACISMFEGCTGLTSVDLSSFAGITANTGCQYMFKGCTSLPSVDFCSLKYMSFVNALQYMFQGCTSLTRVSFYALDTDSFGNKTNQFNNMLSGVTGCTVHFPMSVQAKIGSWADVTNGFGGTNTTVLFDIVTSLTGADSNTYTRKQKESTSTATAWTYNDTLYYTSGTTEPTVGDTIYSDSACTTAVTTISSIA